MNCTIISSHDLMNPYLFTEDLTLDESLQMAVSQAIKDTEAIKSGERKVIKNPNCGKISYVEMNKHYLNMDLDSYPMLDKKPTIIIFAGPNGSGKTTFSKAISIVEPWINADDITELSMTQDNLMSANLADIYRYERIANKASFSTETVLSTDRKLEMLLDAKESGFYIKGFFVLTSNPEINIQRVKDRVIKGGHDVPGGKIVERYFKSLENLRSFIEICDECRVYDNSTSCPMQIAKKINNEVLIFETPRWSTIRTTNLLKLNNNQED